MTARQLIDAGREHVAAGRSQEAVRCFALAAGDPAIAPEARSLLAAAYLLPGTLRPGLALSHARWVAATRPVADEHLTRCALVALCAGDPTLAEELAGRAGGSLPILAAAKARQGDREGVGDLLAGLRLASGPPVYWHRLVLEALRRRWLREALAVLRAMRRAGLSAPRPLAVLVSAAAPWLSAVLLACGLLAAVLPWPLGAVALAGVVVVGAAAVPTDLAAGRRTLALARTAWAAMTVATAFAHWLA